MRILLAFFIGVVGFDLRAQTIADRIEADYSIKEIAPDGKESLIVGKVYFDGINKTLTHSQKFPAENLFVFKDSTVLLVYEDSVMRGSSSALSIELSIYNLLVENSLNDFGLQRKGFQMDALTKEEDKVISDWSLPGAENAGKIRITQKSGQVEGVIFYDPLGKPLVQQYFRDYSQGSGVSFPMKIYEITNTPLGQNKKITTHRNIKINDFSDEDDFYDLFRSAQLRLISTGRN